MARAMPACFCAKTLVRRNSLSWLSRFRVLSRLSTLIRPPPGAASYGGLYRTNNFLTVTVLDETAAAYATVRLVAELLARALFTLYPMCRTLLLGICNGLQWTERALLPARPQPRSVPPLPHRLVWLVTTCHTFSVAW